MEDKDILLVHNVGDSLHPSKAYIDNAPLTQTRWIRRRILGRQIDALCEC